MRTEYFVLALVAYLGSVCEALKCYQCTGTTSSACGDSFDKDGTGVTVSNTAYDGSTCDVCFKFYAEGSGSTRSCFNAGGGSLSGCQDYSYQGTSGTICYCDTELCNGAERSRATVVLPTISCLFVLINVLF